MNPVKPHKALYIVSGILTSTLFLYIVYTYFIYPGYLSSPGSDAGFSWVLSLIYTPFVLIIFIPLSIFMFKRIKNSGVSLLMSTIIITLPVCLGILSMFIFLSPLKSSIVNPILQTKQQMLLNQLSVQPMKLTYEGRIPEPTVTGTIKILSMPNFAVEIYMIHVYNLGKIYQEGGAGCGFQGKYITAIQSNKVIEFQCAGNFNYPNSQYVIIFREKNNSKVSITKIYQQSDFPIH